MPLEPQEHFAYVLGLASDRGRHELVFGPEVVDVADRDVGRAGDVGDRCFLDPLLVDHSAHAHNQALPPKAAALTSGYQLALLVSSIFVLAAAIIALRSSDTREPAASPVIQAQVATDAAGQ